MSEGGNIIRIIGGQSTWTSKQNLDLIATDGDITISSPTKVNIEGIDGGQKFGIYDYEEEVIPDTLYIEDGYWASDANGEIKITEAELGDTVYFVVSLKQIHPNENEIEFKLFEYDEKYMVLLWYIIPQFIPEKNSEIGLVAATGEGTDYEKKEDYKTEKLNGKKAIIKFTLTENGVLENMLNKERKKYLQLFFNVKYGPGFVKESVDLPHNKDLYLKVKYNPRKNLVIVPPVNGYPFPEFFSLEGNPIVMSLIQNSTGFVDSEQISKLSYQIALRELKMGKLYNTIGEVEKTKKLIYTVNQSPIDDKDYYIVRGSNFGYKNGYINDGKLVTTRGLNQLEYFANAGIKNNLLKMGSKILEIGVIDLAGMIVDASEGKMSIFPPIEMIVDYAAGDLNEFIDEAFYLDLENAKIGGINKLQSFINSNNVAREKRYEVLRISNNTLSALLNGELRDYYDINLFMDNSKDGHIKNNFIIVKSEYNSNKQILEYLIISIFINE